MLLEDLIGEPFGGAEGRTQSLEMDPLREEDALQEAQVLDVRLEVLTLTAAVLIELRGALQLRIPYTGLLVARGIEHFVWEAEPRQTEMTAWNIMASQVFAAERQLHTRFDMHPNAGLALSAISMAFYAVDVLGLGDTPPNYGEPGASRRHSDLAQWNSPIEVVSATFRSAL